MTLPGPEPDASAIPNDLAADVAIVGGGLAGLTLAAALGGAGIPTLVVDRDPPEGLSGAAFDGRTTAIATGSARILEAAGVWGDVIAEAGPILDIRVVDGDSPLFLHYDHREVGSDPFGWIVENRVLRRALLKRLAALPSVAHLPAMAVTGLRRDVAGATLTLGDGRTVRARLVVGADGKKSLVRAAADIPVHGWNYGQSAIVTTVEHDGPHGGPHGGVAVERFLPAGPFAMLPMTGDRTSIVWTERADLAEWYVGLPEARFTAELQIRVGDWLGRVRPIGPRGVWPLGLMYAERHVADRVALINEAVHVMHPIAGQGLNVGIRDVAALAEVVVDAWRLGLDPGARDTLDRYQRWRGVDTAALLATTDLLNRLFSNAVGPVRLARRLGLAAVNTLPPLRPAKRLFMRHAMGLVGTLPRMTSGRPL